MSLRGIKHEGIEHEGIEREGINPSSIEVARYPGIVGGRTAKCKQQAIGLGPRSAQVGPGRLRGRGGRGPGVGGEPMCRTGTCNASRWPSAG